MDEFSNKLNNFENGKFSFLRLFGVCLDRTLGLCELTFLYPENVEISDEIRSEMQQFAEENLKINSKVKVKFKKSFLDERLLRKQVLSFFENNYKSISAQLTEKQIDIVKEDGKVKIFLHMCQEVINLFENLFAKKALLGELNDNFIADFEIEPVLDESFNIADEVPVVPIKVPPKRVLRYEVDIVKSLFGKDIAPHPELIKNNTAPKPSLILFGTISGVQKKTFVAKSGKRKGEEKIFYTFNLNDGKSVECVYFCSKTNEKRCECLSDGMTFLCLGDLKMGLGDKLTYYINAMTYAQIKTPPEEEEPEVFDRKLVATIEDYNDHQQQNLFVKNPTYKEPIASRDIVVYDLETTGLSPETDEIIEIGAVKLERGKITKKFYSFVKPIQPISSEITKITHITNEMVADAPKVEDVIIDFYNFCDGCMISGYNNTDFDNKFLRKAAQKAGVKFNNDNIDVFQIARVSRLNTHNLKLGTVAAALGVDLTGAHRAYNDAIATAKVLLKLSEE